MSMWVTVVILALGIFCLIQAVYFGLMYCAWPPSIPSDAKSRKVMAELAAARRPRVMYDLGSGFGHLVFAAAHACPSAEVRGVERFPLPFHISRALAALRRKAGFSGKASFIRGDMFATDFRDADLLLCFLLRGKMMERVRDEIWPQLKPGAAFICNGAPMPGVTPDSEHPIALAIGTRIVYLYVKRT